MKLLITVFFAVKSHKKDQEFYAPFRRYIFQKTIGERGGRRFRPNGLMDSELRIFGFTLA